MSEGTKIEWTHRPGTIPATMNALVGCQKVSQGCARCYAIEVAHIRAGNPLQVLQDKFAGTTRAEGGKRVWTGKVTLTEKALLDPLRRKKPRTYFVNALSDLFYEGVPNEWVDKHWAVFNACPQHTFIVLTKRPERMKEYLTVRNGNHPGGIKMPLENVWLGCSVENQETANARIPELLQTPAAVRFISAEPLLESINLTAIRFEPGGSGGPVYVDALRGTFCSVGGSGYPAWGRLNQVIVGGESGNGARPMHPDWARSARDQCVSASVPFFFKQWGDLAPGAQQANYASAGKMFTRIDIAGNPSNDPTKWLASDALFYKVGKKAAGHLLDGVEWRQFPEVS